MAIGFWEVLVRKSPNPWFIANTLAVFIRSGEEDTALAFWKKMRTASSKEKHLNYFYAKRCKETGDFGEAISAWMKGLDFIVDSTEEKTLIQFPVECVAQSLQSALTFDHECYDVIQTWERSLRGAPARARQRCADIRQNYIASTFLESVKLSGAMSNEVLQKVASLCPFKEEIVSQLRAQFEREQDAERE